MEQINLSEFLSLFGYTSVDDCWLNADCIIDESGIKTRHIAKHSDKDYINRTDYSQCVELSFPCTAQQIFLWAQCLDKWERSSAVGSQSHVVEKLPKEIVDKWQPVNELYRGWCYVRGVIKEKIGTEPFNVNWNYWLSLPEWDKKQAALLISGLEPDKFHLIENLADYKGMCEPLVKLLRKIPDALTQCPFDWLNWFDEIGYLINAPKPLRVWFVEQQSNIVAPQAEAVANDDVSQGYIEPASAKVIQANSNEFEFSGLLHQPSGKDDWFEVIDVMTKAFYDEHNAMPTKAQAWTQLCTNPPPGYGIKPDENEQSLTMPGVIKAFNKRSFDRRWAKYTAKSNPYQPN